VIEAIKKGHSFASSSDIIKFEKVEPAGEKKIIER